MERTYTLQDLLAALKRRRMLATLVAAVVLVGGAVALLAMPTEYQAQSVVQIEPHRLAPDFFPAQNFASFEDRMRTLKHGILARPVLERVLRETRLYPGMSPDDAVEELRRHTEIRLEGEVAGGPPALLFVVEVRGRDPAKIAKAAELLPQAYAEMTRTVMADQARNLRQTLEAQVADVSRELSRNEAQLLAFKTQHATELPEAVEANTRAAGRIESQIEMQQGAIVDAERRSTLVVTSIPELDSDAGRAQGGAEDVLRRLQAARAAYGADHPDVRRLEREWQEAKARRVSETEKFRNDRVQTHLDLISAEVKDRKATIASLERSLAEVQARIEAAPHWGEQLRALSRDYETLRARYATVVARAQDSRSAEALLAADASGLFRTLQPAVAPRQPTGPNRWNLLWVVVATAIASGLLAAALAEYLDRSLRGPEDAVAMGVPVLAAIPRIGPRRSGARTP